MATLVRTCFQRNDFGVVLSMVGTVVLVSDGVCE